MTGSIGNVSETVEEIVDTDGDNFEYSIALTFFSKQLYN